MGVRLADSPLRAAQRRGRLEGLRLQVEIEPFTTQIAEHYADIFAELMQGGQMIRKTIRRRRDRASRRFRRPRRSERREALSSSARIGCGSAAGKGLVH